MYAVIETGGKQYKVQEGDVITVEKLKAEAGDTITFDKVLLMSDGKEVKVGTPYLAEAVTGLSLIHISHWDWPRLWRLWSETAWEPKMAYCLKTPYLLKKQERLK